MIAATLGLTHPQLPKTLKQVLKSLRLSAIYHHPDSTNQIIFFAKKNQRGHAGKYHCIRFKLLVQLVCESVRGVPELALF